MKVTFTYQTTLGGAATTALVLGTGQRLSPLSPVQFSGTGIVQETFPVRSEIQVPIPRGGGLHRESLVCQREHADYGAAVIWSRLELGRARGKGGTLFYEFDRGGRIKLINAVLESYANAPGVVGIVTLIQFNFVGTQWQSA